MPDTYTVAEVLNQREWAPQDDPTKKTIFFEFRAEGVDKVCSIGRKPGNELKVGESFEATATEDRGKLKLKRVQQAGGFGGGGKRDPQTEHRITRQHSQDMGIQTLRLGLELDVVKRSEVESVKEIVTMVKTLADVYDRDAWEDRS